LNRRPFSRHRASRDAERLARLAQGLAHSGNRLEDAWWEAQMAAVIDKALQSGNDDPLNQALDRLHEGDVQTPGRAYELLADLIEAGCEISPPTLETETACVLLALPVLAWSRYVIPTRSVPAATLDALRAHLTAHVLGEVRRVHFADYLFSPDQLPQGYVQTRVFADALWAATRAGQDMKVQAESLPESQNFISDVRYLVAAVEVQIDQPLFRWNSVDGLDEHARNEALAAWRAQGGPNLQALLTGCLYEMLLPESYFNAWRHADQDARPFALKAAAAYLQLLLGVTAAQLAAVVAPYYEQHLEEWRISFLFKGQVVHGVTWPLLGQEDESGDVSTQLVNLLTDAGIQEVRVLDTRMPLEYCDDCGAPLFPNVEGENVHSEMPEGTHNAPTHLH